MLVLRFRAGKVVTDDPGGRCKSYCGARGGFQQIELPKLSPDEAERKRQASEAPGWRVTYARFVDEAGVPMPAKIGIEGERARLRVIVDRWDLR